jgi:hypothetical protein
MIEMNNEDEIFRKKCLKEMTKLMRKEGVVWKFTASYVEGYKATMACIGNQMEVCDPIEWQNSDVPEMIITDVKGSFE